MNDISSVFAALSDPTRQAIVARLAKGEATVNELTAPFKISQPAISRHLKVLELAGIVDRRIDGTRRPCRLSPRGLDPIDNWLESLRAVMEANYARLDMVLKKSETNTQLPPQ